MILVKAVFHDSFTRAGNNRPDIVPHQDFDHPFVNDYYNGITKTEAERRIKEMLKTISERDNNTIPTARFGVDTKPPQT